MKKLGKKLKSNAGTLQMYTYCMCTNCVCTATKDRADSKYESQESQVS